MELARLSPSFLACGGLIPRYRFLKSGLRLVSLVFEDWAYAGVTRWCKPPETNGCAPLRYTRGSALKDPHIHEKKTKSTVSRSQNALSVQRRAWQDGASCARDQLLWTPKIRSRIQGPPLPQKKKNGENYSKSLSESSKCSFSASAKI